MEARSADLEKENQEQINGLQSSIKRNGEDADKKRRDLEGQVSALTKERDELGLQAKAAEYAQKRHKKELDNLREEQAAAQSSAAQKTRDVLDQRRRDLERQTLLLTQQRDKAQSERDNHELRARALEYSHKREKKAAAEKADEEKDGLRQAHNALLQYHNHAKKDWKGLLWQADHEIALLRLRKDAALRSYIEAQKLQYENDALRLQKQALKGDYDKVYALRYQVEALQLQKQALRNEYDKLLNLKLENDALRMQKDILRSEYDKLLNLKLENEALRLQKKALMQAYEGNMDLGNKLRGAQHELAAVRENHRALGEYYRNKNVDSDARYSGAQHELLLGSSCTETWETIMPSLRNS